MKRLLVVLLAIISSTIAVAQLVIEGRQAFWDKQANTFLATLPDSCFQHSVSLHITSPQTWKNCLFEGQSILHPVNISNLSADHYYTLRYEDENGQQTEARLQFTLLPIIRLEATVSKVYSEGKILLSDPHNNLTNMMSCQVKRRGNTTNTDDKHKLNYTVKLLNDTSLLGMRNDNKWILDAGQPDVFRLRNRIAMDIWKDFNSKPYYYDMEPKVRNSVSGKVVEVFLNNEYVGIYNLSEPLDRKQMKLKKVSLSGDIHGCMYKVNQYGYGNMNDTVHMYDNRSEMWEYIEMSYPDLNDCDTTDWSTLYNALNFITFSSDEEFEQQVADYFDLPVVVDISIFIATVNALDNRGKNVQWAVYDKAVNKKLTPALWDLDCTVGQEWLTEDIRGPEILFDWQIGLTNRLIANNVLGFNDQLNSRYKELRQSLLTTDNLINRYYSYYQLLKKSGAAERDAQKWSGDSDVRGETIDFDQEISYISDWLTVHMEWLDNAWFPLDKWYEWYESTLESINQPTATQQRYRKGIYTLNGQRVMSDYESLKPGIYICNGRKIVVR